MCVSVSRVLRTQTFLLFLCTRCVHVVYTEAGHHVQVALQRVTEDGEDLIRALLGPLFESVNR